MCTCLYIYIILIFTNLHFSNILHFHLINIEETKFQVHELVQNIFFLSVISASGGTRTLWQEKGWYHPSSYLSLYFYLDFYSTWVYIKLLNHIWVLVILMESPQYSGPPSQHRYLSALSGVHSVPSRLPSWKRILKALSKGIVLQPVFLWKENFCRVQVFVRVAPSHNCSKFIVFQ